MPLSATTGSSLQTDNGDEVLLWEINTENETNPAITDYGTSAPSYSRDGKSLFAGSRDGLVWVLDIAGENPPRLLHQAEIFDATGLNEADPEYLPAVVAVFSSHDGKRAYAVEATGSVWKWNTADWSDGGHYRISPGVSGAALSPNGQVIAFALEDGTVRFHASETGQLKLVLASSTDANSALVIAPDCGFDFGIPSDTSLAAYRVARTTATVDNLPGNRWRPGLLAGFLKENAAMQAGSPSGTHGQ